MKAVTRTQYGTPEVLAIKDIPKPIPKEDEVLVKVHATTVNRTDCGILTGKPYLIRLFTGLTKPSSLVPGTDFAGEIEAVGKKVTTFSVGDRVWGLNDEGLASQAQYMTIKAKKAITSIPDQLNYDEVVACAEGAHYAYNFITKVKLNRGDKVLVNGATGAIGSAAVQLLKHFGAIVSAVGNTKNEVLVKSLGADHFFNYEKDDFTKVTQEKYHFIFDAVGKSSFGKCKKLLLPNGIYISSELGPNAENLYLPFSTKLRSGPRVIFPIPVNGKRSILFLKGLIENGEFTPVIDKKYPMDQIQEAYTYVLSGQKTGNVIVNY